MSARAAASAKLPPEPMAMVGSSGSMTSPLPESDQERVAVGGEQQRLEAPQNAVGAPVLGQLHGGARQVAVVLLELGLELVEQREGVGAGAGEAGQDAAAVQPPHLAGAALHDRVAERDLSVARHHDHAAVSQGENRGAADRRGGSGCEATWQGNLHTDDFTGRRSKGCAAAQARGCALS